MRVLISWTDATTLFHEFGHAFMDCLQMLLIRLLPVLPLPGIMWNFLLKFWSAGLKPRSVKQVCIAL
jgi:hypothetical protein